MANIIWSRDVRPETRTRCSFSQVPAPFSAKNNSSMTGLKITDAIIEPLYSSAIDNDQWGNPCMKLSMPSNGCAIQRRVGSSPFVSRPPVPTNP